MALASWNSNSSVGGSGGTAGYALILIFSHFNFSANLSCIDHMIFEILEPSGNASSFCSKELERGD